MQLSASLYLHFHELMQYDALHLKGDRMADTAPSPRVDYRIAPDQYRHW